MAGQLFRQPIVPPYYIEDFWISVFNSHLGLLRSLRSRGHHIFLVHKNVYLKLFSENLLSL